MAKEKKEQNGLTKEEGTLEEGVGEGRGKERGDSCTNFNSNCATLKLLAIDFYLNSPGCA